MVDGDAEIYLSIDVENHELGRSEAAFVNDLAYDVFVFHLVC